MAAGRMKPLDAFVKVLDGAAVSSRRLAPGEIIAHAPREIREALKELTSDDVARLRLRVVEGGVWRS